MNETAQFLLITVVTLLTLLLIVIGIQFFLILKEVRRSVERLNKILEDTGVISESIARPVSSLSSSLGSFSGIAGLLSWLLNKRKNSKEKDE